MRFIKPICVLLFMVLTTGKFDLKNSTLCSIINMISWASQEFLAK